MNVAVSITPLPAWARKLDPRLRPMHPPIFPDGEPEQADLELALELIEALDEESRAHYGHAEARIRAMVKKIRETPD